jgi:hypothetical protein
VHSDLNSNYYSIFAADCNPNLCTISETIFKSLYTAIHTTEFSSFNHTNKSAFISAIESTLQYAQYATHPYSH